jgi:hypothetical protein
MTNWITDFLARSELSKYPFQPIRNGVVFKQSGGKHIAVIQNQPVHYYEAGRFKPIDTALQTGQSGRYSAPGLSPIVLPSGEVCFPGGYHHRTRGAGIFDPSNEIYSELVRFCSGTVSLNKLIRDRGKYTHEIILSEKHLKEQIIIQEKPHNLESGWFVIETEILDQSFPKGNFKQGLKYNNIVFNGGTAWDTSDELLDVSQFILERPGANTIIYSGIPVEWLEKAVFPVTIDPTFTSQPGISGKDTYISQPSSSSNYGSLNKMYFGSNGSSSGLDFAALMQFDLSSLAGCSVDSASLTVTKHSDSATNSLTVTLQRILVNWLENEATWNNRISSSGWTSPGCLSSSDRENAALGSVTYAPSDPNLVSKTISLDTTKVQEWLNGTLDNKGFRFGYNGDIDLSTYYAIFSSDEATSSYRPKLEINYTVLGRNFSVPAMFIR